MIEEVKDFPIEIELTEIERLKLENLHLKMIQLDTQAQMLNQQKMNLLQEVETRLNVDLRQYHIDLQSGIGKFMGKRNLKEKTNGNG